MRIGIGIGLNKHRPSGSALDADARDYIDAVETALSAFITPTQKGSVNAWFKGEKTSERYDLHKRVYLPIWANAAANAIDMISRTSGTFVNTSDHQPGYVQGNGTDSYFSLEVTPISLGLSSGDASLFFLAFDYVAGSEKGFIGSSTSGFASALNLQSAVTANSTRFISPSLSGAVVGGNTVGIVVGSNTSTSSRFISNRLSSGVSVLSNTITDTTNLPDLTLYAMARNLSGSAQRFNNAKFGSYGAGLGMSESQAEGFSLNLKTLWETATGLTLP